MGRVGGVSEQHDVARAPARVAHGDKADPLGVVGLKRVALQGVGEQLLAVGDARLVADPRRQGRAAGQLPESARCQVSSATSTMNVLMPELYGYA